MGVKDENLAGGPDFTVMHRAGNLERQPCARVLSSAGEHHMAPTI